MVPLAQKWTHWVCDRAVHRSSALVDFDVACRLPDSHTLKIHPHQHFCAVFTALQRDRCSYEIEIPAVAMCAGPRWPCSFDGNAIQHGW